MASSDFDPPHQEVVKCVVVGDTGVGKTRLICSQACGTRYSLPQLVASHAPTVWAIDHYRHDREVLERANCTVDNTNISLRLWDTFGYHDKDRRFAYGRADVILLCFCTVSPKTLKNVSTVWYPEIKRFCPSAPIVLVGCKIDLRHLYLDRDFIKMDKGPFFRAVEPLDVITPEQGRKVALEIGASQYYETSVLNQFGVTDVFENVVRAALIHRHSIRFWMPHLKHVKMPRCQSPWLPDKPHPPKVSKQTDSKFQENMVSLFNTGLHTDVTFMAEGIPFEAHRVCLAVASPVLLDLFLTDTSRRLKRSLSYRTKSAQSGNAAKRTMSLSKSRTLSDRSEFTADSDTHKLLDDVFAVPASTEQRPKALTLPAFSNVKYSYKSVGNSPDKTRPMVVVTLNKQITARAFQYILYYLYTGTAREDYDILTEVKTAADLFHLKDLIKMLDNMMCGEAFLNADIEKCFQEKRRSRIRDLVLKNGLLSDVKFHLEDGATLNGHKPLLIANCEVMAAMFAANFLESSSNVVSFPYVSRETIYALLEYLYIDECPSLVDVDGIELIALANELCLPSLVGLVEGRVIQEMGRVMAESREMTLMHDVFALLESAQLHNANNLANWCIWYLSTNYMTVQKKYGKLFKKLSPPNQEEITKHRWPPLWYLEEEMHYERAFNEQERKSTSGMKSRRSNQGCLCFSSRSRQDSCRSED